MPLRSPPCARSLKQRRFVVFCAAWAGGSYFRTDIRDRDEMACNTSLYLRTTDRTGASRPVLYSQNIYGGRFPLKLRRAPEFRATD
jgi:hypothetical protein